MTASLTTIDQVVSHIENIERRVTSLEAARPGRKRKPIIAPKQEHVCCLDPSRDSTTCPDAGVYRFQQGCLGDACVRENTTYYATYRSKNKRTKEVTVDAD